MLAPVQIQGGSAAQFVAVAVSQPSAPKAEADDEQMILRWPLIYYRRKMRFLSPQLEKIAQGLGRAGRSIGEGGN